MNKIILIICALVLSFTSCSVNKEVLVKPQNFDRLIYVDDYYYYIYQNVVIKSDVQLDSIPSEFYGKHVDMKNIYIISEDFD